VDALRGAIGAFVAEMDFGTAPAVTAALHDAVDSGRLGYLTTEAAVDMGRACADWQRRRYGWDVPPERITPLADVVAGLQATIEKFTPRAVPSSCPHRPTCRS
jgi:cystathionine beta-lyase